MYSEVLELLRSGVEVYVLKDRRVLEKYKREMMEMVRTVFIDTKWNPKKRQKSKKHVYYDLEKDVFIEVDSLTELKDYDGIYLDSLLFPNM